MSSLGNTRPSEANCGTERQAKRPKTNEAPVFSEIISVRTVRLSTFSHWPHPERFRCRMIEAGFFGCTIDDRAICIYCNLMCHQWDINLDNPCEVHKTRSPGCPFVKSMSCCHSLQHDKIVSTFPTYKDYVDPQKRLATFPHESNHGISSVDKLVEAGFFYYGSKLVCFCCNGELENLPSNNHPIAEHVRQFPRCNYARRLCGEELYHTIQFFERNTSDCASTDRSTDTRQQLIKLAENVIAEYVNDRLGWPMSIHLLNRGEFEQSIIQQSWTNLLRLKGDAFVTDQELYMSCLIHKSETQILAGDQTNIIVPKIALQDIYEPRRIALVKNSNRSVSDTMSSFGNDYQTYRNARQTANLEFTEDEEITVQREHSLYNCWLDKPSRCQMIQGGWLMCDKEDCTSRCPHCYMQYSNWKKEDDPLLIHRYLSPLCPFVLSSNPISKNPVSMRKIQELYTDEVIAAAEFQPYVGLVQSRDGSNASVANRQLSFTALPGVHRLDTDALAGHGLHYSNLQNSINCFYCTRKISLWSHIPRSNYYFRQLHPPSRCRYLQQFNDQDPVPPIQPASKKCTWCLTDDKRLLALPCRHFCLCEACGQIKRLCAKCNQRVTTYLVVYCP